MRIKQCFTDQQRWDILPVENDAGIQIDLRREQFRNTPSPTSRSLKLCSNVILSRDKQEEKQNDGITSTEAGMKIDFSDAQPRNA
jgi:hypothetical protein